MARHFWPWSPRPAPVVPARLQSDDDTATARALIEARLTQLRKRVVDLELAALYRDDDPKEPTP